MLFFGEEFLFRKDFIVSKLLRMLTIAVVGGITIFLMYPSGTVAHAAIIPSSHIQQSSLPKCHTYHVVQVQQKSVVTCISLVAQSVSKVKSSVAISPSCPYVGSNGQIKPYCTYYSNCPTGKVYASAYDSNNAKFAGPVWNNCGFDLTNGEISITVNIACPGTTPGSGGDTLYVGNWANGQSYLYSFSFIGYCEVCQNHVATAFPSFTLFADLAVSGRYSGNTYLNDPSDGTNIGMSNSPAYRFPCP